MIMNENNKQYIHVAVIVIAALIAGVAVMMFIGKSAAYAAEYKDTDKKVKIASFQNLMNQGVEWYGPAPLYGYCCYPVTSTYMAVLGKGDSFGGVESFDTYQVVAGSDNVYGTFQLKNEGYYVCEGLGITIDDSYSVYIPRFSSETLGKQYARGEIGIEYAENYEEIKGKMAAYDSVVPSPDKLYIQDMSEASVSVAWQYTDSGIDLTGVTYQVKVEHFYMSSSLMTSIAKGYTGKNGESSYKFNHSTDSMNRLIVEDTVETYLSAPTNLLADSILVSENVNLLAGTMHSTNVIYVVPTDYSGQFASSGNAFFTGLSNSHVATYCGTQVTLIPYKEIDGQLVKGNVCVARRFMNDILNGLVGSTYTQIGQDDSGNEYIASSSYQDTNGNETDLIGSLDEDSLLKNIRNGFGLSGTNGYIEMARQFFIGIPVSIWVLIGTALSVNIVVIVFKALRGM